MIPRVRWLSTPAAPTRARLGRPSNHLSSGLVGLANVGKSTLFQAITKSPLGNPANYPFATIDPEKSIIQVSSPALAHYAQIYGSAKVVPTTHTLWDIAGLVRHCSSGHGLGNKFLNDIRQVDGIFQVVRGFDDEDVTHVENSVDPVRDLSIVADELILKDLEYVESASERLAKLVKKPGQSGAIKELELMETVSEMLYEGQPVRVGAWSEEDATILNKYNFLTAKPSVYLVNVSETDYATQTSKYLKDIRQWVADSSFGDEPDPVVLVSAAAETKMATLEGEELSSYEQELGRGSAISTLVDEMRSALGLISFYTCGPEEAHQWSVRQGSTAPEAAGVIHTDLQKTFISSLVYKWDDLKHEQEFNEAKLKQMGKQFRHGKKYVVEDGDVITVKASAKK
ncbi:hypothetical protein DIURU_002544 [Diutina rugosa]|uniref:Obg-like ATPase homolog n=1 Tax=Diutina rugosa TaxID=5481 RepID=A0A642UQA5_DIURU|nr:uncharacterized protein DIURU_002544 [Diutina rugosa]KAA8903257.1 hypothetical protein DIURU_002544 [Diutina rugosa]